MKAFIVMTVARQVQGEYVGIKPEKGFNSASKAEKYAASMGGAFVESFTTVDGPIQCVCERGVFEIEIEE